MYVLTSILFCIVIYVVVTFIYFSVWSFFVNSLGIDDFDMLRIFRKRKRCLSCLETFKTPVPVAQFGKMCPHCDTPNNYEVIPKGRKRR